MDGERGDVLLDRHSYAGEAYGFHADVLHIRMSGDGALGLGVLIVGEFWRRGDGGALHATKCAKLLSGKPTDVLKWIGAHRDRTA